MPFSSRADRQKDETEVSDDIPIETKIMYEKMDAVDKNLDKMKSSLQRRYSKLVSAQVDRLREKQRELNNKQYGHVTTKEKRNDGSSNRHLNSRNINSVDNLDESRSFGSENKTGAPIGITRIRIRQYKKIDDGTSGGNDKINNDNEINSECRYPKITFKQTYIRRTSPEMSKIDSLRDTAKGMKNVMPNAIGVENHAVKELDLSEAFAISKGTERSSALYLEPKHELKISVVSHEMTRNTAMDSPLSGSEQGDNRSTLEGVSRLESSRNPVKSPMSDRDIKERNGINWRDKKSYEVERTKSPNFDKPRAIFHEHKKNKSKDDAFSTHDRVSPIFAKNDGDISESWRVLKYSPETAHRRAGSPVTRSLTKMVDRLEEYNERVSPRMERIKKSLSPQTSPQGNYDVPAIEYNENGLMETDRQNNQQTGGFLDTYEAKTEAHSGQNRYSYSRGINQQMNYITSLGNTEKGVSDEFGLENDHQRRKHERELQSFTNSDATSKQQSTNYDHYLRVKSEDVPDTHPSNNAADNGVYCKNTSAHLPNDSEMAQVLYSKPSNKSETKSTPAYIENVSGKSYHRYRKMENQSKNNEFVEQNEFSVSPHVNNQYGTVMMETNKETSWHQVPTDKSENLTTSTQNSQIVISKRHFEQDINSEDTAQKEELSSPKRHSVADFKIDKIETATVLTDKMPVIQDQYRLPRDKKESPPTSSTKDEQGGYRSQVDQYKIPKLAIENEAVEYQGRYRKDVKESEAPKLKIENGHESIRERNSEIICEKETPTLSRQSKPEVLYRRFHGRVDNNEPQAMVTRNESFAISTRHKNPDDTSEAPVLSTQNRNETIHEKYLGTNNRYKTSVLIPRDECSSMKNGGNGRVSQDELIAKRGKNRRPVDEINTQSLCIHDDSEVQSGEKNRGPNESEFRQMSIQDGLVAKASRNDETVHQCKSPTLMTAQDKSDVIRSPVASTKANIALPLTLEQPVTMYHEFEERKLRTNEHIQALTPSCDKDMSLPSEPRHHLRNQKEHRRIEMPIIAESQPLDEQDQYTYALEKSDVLSHESEKMKERFQRQYNERKVKPLSVEKYKPFLTEDRYLNNHETMTSRYCRLPVTEKYALSQEKTDSVGNQYKTHTDVKNDEPSQIRENNSEFITESKRDIRMVEIPKNSRVRKQDRYIEHVSKREASEKPLYDENEHSPDRYQQHVVTSEINSLGQKKFEAKGDRFYEQYEKDKANTSSAPDNKFQTQPRIQTIGGKILQPFKDGNESELPSLQATYPLIKCRSTADDRAESSTKKAPPVQNETKMVKSRFDRADDDRKAKMSNSGTEMVSEQITRAADAAIPIQWHKSRDEYKVINDNQQGLSGAAHLGTFGEGKEISAPYTESDAKQGNKRESNEPCGKIEAFIRTPGSVRLKRSFEEHIGFPLKSEESTFFHDPYESIYEESCVRSQQNLDNRYIDQEEINQQSDHYSDKGLNGVQDTDHSRKEYATNCHDTGNYRIYLNEDVERQQSGWMPKENTVRLNGNSNGHKADENAQSTSNKWKEYSLSHLSKSLSTRRMENAIANRDTGWNGSKSKTKFLKFHELLKQHLRMLKNPEFNIKSYNERGLTNERVGMEYDSEDVCDENNGISRPMQGGKQSYSLSGNSALLKNKSTKKENRIIYPAIECKQNLAPTIKERDQDSQEEHYKIPKTVSFPSTGHPSFPRKQYNQNMEDEYQHISESKGDEQHVISGCDNIDVPSEYNTHTVYKLNGDPDMKRIIKSAENQIEELLPEKSKHFQVVKDDYPRSKETRLVPFAENIHSTVGQKAVYVTTKIPRELLREQDRKTNLFSQSNEKENITKSLPAKEQNDRIINNRNSYRIQMHTIDSDEANSTMPTPSERNNMDTFKSRFNEVNIHPLKRNQDQNINRTGIPRFPTSDADHIQRSYNKGAHIILSENSRKLKDNKDDREKTFGKENSSSQNIKDRLFQKENHQESEISDCSGIARPLKDKMRAQDDEDEVFVPYIPSNEKGSKTHMIKTKLGNEEKRSVEEWGFKDNGLGFKKEINREAQDIKYDINRSRNPACNSKAVVKERQHSKTERTNDKKVTTHYKDYENKKRIRQAEKHRFDTSKDRNVPLFENNEEKQQPHVNQENCTRQLGNQIIQEDIEPSYLIDRMGYEVRKRRQPNGNVFHPENFAERTKVMPRKENEFTATNINERSRKEKPNEESLWHLRRFKNKSDFRNEHHKLSIPSKDSSGYQIQRRDKTPGETNPTQDLIGRAIGQVYSYWKQREEANESKTQEYEYNSDSQSKHSKGSQTMMGLKADNVPKSEQSSQTEVHIRSDQKQNMEDNIFDIYSDRAELTKDRISKITTYSNKEDGGKNLVNRMNEVGTEPHDDEFHNFIRKAVHKNVHRLHEDIERVLSVKDLIKPYTSSMTDDNETEEVVQIANEADDMLLARLETLLSLCGTYDNEDEISEPLKQLLDLLQHACFDPYGRPRDHILMDEISLALTGLTLFIENEWILDKSPSGENIGEASFDDDGTGKEALEEHTAAPVPVSYPREINFDGSSRRQHLNAEQTTLFERQYTLLKRNLHVIVLGLGIITGITMVLLGPLAARMIYDFVISCIMYVICNVRLVQPNPPIT